MQAAFHILNFRDGYPRGVSDFFSVRNTKLDLLCRMPGIL